jgi:hypothetical protein
MKSINHLLKFLPSNTIKIHVYVSLSNGGYVVEGTELWNQPFIHSIALQAWPDFARYGGLSPSRF